MARILVGCEESQAVCIEFRKLGHEAYSCDIIPCSGGHPEWHIQRDLLEVFDDGWDILIAFPPCTHLAVSGARYFEIKRKDGRQKQGIDFFMAMVNAPIERIAIENPIGIMSSIYREPDQIIHPYYFGDPFTKSTCLWLKNLPKLVHSKEITLFDNEITHTHKGEFFEWKDGKTGKMKRQAKWYADAFKLKPDERAKVRSKTFPGIALEMARQWSEYLNQLK
jgi:hypothetical protein